ncbi:hypothetical protein [Capnocytophaga canimorsus]|uniref:hypothetical protein n=1 Tax=Capnocytophaga canimorsus TaxID=28188 RepID=UPI0037D4D7D4
MKKLTIKNIGPIKEVTFNIKKINVFMGKQSSGKSTIAKILSFCSWVEKDISFNQSFDKFLEGDYFVNYLKSFHKMERYIKEDSYIEYYGDAVHIEYSNSKVSIKWLEARFDYKRPKISYIPSERNLIALPEISQVKFPDNYLRSYLLDWLNVRQNYNYENKVSVLDTNTSYYFSESDASDHIVGDDYDIPLSAASSGLQSITSLLITLDYLTMKLYNKKEELSFEKENVRYNTAQLIVSEIVLRPLYGKIFEGEERTKVIEEFNKRLADKSPREMELFKKFKDIRNNLLEYNSTNLIIEEPEQNLFPATQKELTYQLLEYLNKSEYDHTMAITTHSPYILYAINNCMLAHLVKDKNEDSKLKNSMISPEDINIFEIEDGKNRSIQKENGLIGDNYFDQQMKEVMDDFYQSLNYL